MFQLLFEGLKSGFPAPPSADDAPLCLQDDRLNRSGRPTCPRCACHKQLSAECLAARHCCPGFHAVARLQCSGSAHLSASCTNPAHTLLCRRWSARKTSTLSASSVPSAPAPLQNFPPVVPALRAGSAPLSTTQPFLLSRQRQAGRFQQLTMWPSVCPAQRASAVLAAASSQSMGPWRWHTEIATPAGEGGALSVLHILMRHMQPQHAHETMPKCMCETQRSLHKGFQVAMRHQLDVIFLLVRSGAITSCS